MSVGNLEEIIDGGVSPVSPHLRRRRPRRAASRHTALSTENACDPFLLLLPGRACVHLPPLAPCSPTIPSLLFPLRDQSVTPSCLPPSARSTTSTSCRSWISPSSSHLDAVLLHNWACRTCGPRRGRRRPDGERHESGQGASSSPTRTSAALEDQIQEINEAVELPVTHPELYEDIGIKPRRACARTASRPLARASWPRLWRTAAARRFCAWWGPS